MFFGKKDEKVADASNNQVVEYTAGVYNTSIKLNDNILNLEVVIDQNQISSVRLLNIDESISTMYPVLESSVSKIEQQLVNGVSIDNIEYTSDSKYTQMMLVDAISATLKKAKLAAN